MAIENENLKGRWNEVKGHLKKEYGQLSDDDLAYEEGKEDEMLGKLQMKLGKTKDEIRNFINRVIRGEKKEDNLGTTDVNDDFPRRG